MKVFNAAIDRITEDFKKIADVRQVIPNEALCQTLCLRDISPQSLMAIFVLMTAKHWPLLFSSTTPKRLNRMMGAKYQQLLDNIQAYFYFPLANAKNGYIANGTISAEVMPVDGLIDQAGVIASGIQNIGNYFVLRLNSLEYNLILFEYMNCRRVERYSVVRTLKAGRWYQLKVAISGRSLRACIDDEPTMTYEADRSLVGYVGLWTKADSVTWFKNFEMNQSGADVTFDLFKGIKRSQTEEG